MKFRIFRKGSKDKSSSSKFDFTPAHVAKIEAISSEVKEFEEKEEKIENNERQLKTDEPITAFEGNEL